MTYTLNTLVATTIAARAHVDTDMLTRMIGAAKRAGFSHFVLIPNSQLIGFGTNSPNEHRAVDDVVLNLADW